MIDRQSGVRRQLRKLARDGFIVYEPYGAVELTGAGREVAVGIVRRRGRNAFS